MYILGFPCIPKLVYGVWTLHQLRTFLPEGIWRRGISSETRDLIRVISRSARNEKLGRSCNETRFRVISALLKYSQASVLLRANAVWAPEIY